MAISGSVSIPHIIKLQRAYHAWVASETLEDYALRYAPPSFRKWSEAWVGNTAFGAVSFLVLEAIGGTLVLRFGFINAIAAILAVGLLIFLTGLPIAYYAARYNVDVDLLTRGAGFGYLGSTLTSLIYASFTFIFFALEATVMAVALHMGVGTPMSVSYLLSALIIIPLVTHGISAIGRLQAYSLPIWLALMITPYVFILWHNPHAILILSQFGGRAHSHRVNALLFGGAATICFSLIAQIGEQADYLRFMPPLTTANRRAWWTTILLSGSGWILPGILKQLGGALLAVLLFKSGASYAAATNPTQMYWMSYQSFLPPTTALYVTVVFVVLSQVKINVTNAYAGSLAWSNFFSRMTHVHPGRVVWLVFNVSIALLLMELRVFSALVHVLGMYANFATAWIGALVADLTINKTVGLSPPGIEFRRAYLYDINPVGVGAALLGAGLGIAAFLGVFGPLAAAFSPFLALTGAFVAAPAIAYLTSGRYYTARSVATGVENECTICGQQFAAPDMAHCPAYEGAICSLCCTLESRCHDACKPTARAAYQIERLLARLLPVFSPAAFHVRIVRFLVVFLILAAIVAAFMGIVYTQSQLSAAPHSPLIAILFVKIYAALLVILGLGSWWLVLAQESRHAAEDEANNHNQLLQEEINKHAETLIELAAAKEAADHANLAKSRFISAISHELRTPLNSLLGYTEILVRDPLVTPKQQQALSIMQKSGSHLLGLIEDILDMASIEARKLTIHPDNIDLLTLLEQVSSTLRIEADAKGLSFRLRLFGELPQRIRGDARRIRQILINLLSNAIHSTEHGEVTLGARYTHQILHITVTDTGSGLTNDEMGALFTPFQRLGKSTARVPGTGLGLTITKMIIEYMGGDIQVASTPEQGTVFHVRLFCPQLHGTAPLPPPAPPICGYKGPARRILIIDSDAQERDMWVQLLSPLGFCLADASTAETARDIVMRGSPDLILLDLHMPSPGGSDLAQELRRGGYQGLILALSADIFGADQSQTSDSPFDDLIVKPASLRLILDKLKLHLGLSWLTSPEMVDKQPTERALPSVTALAGLQDYARAGDIKGLLANLEALAGESAAYGPFIADLKTLAQAFRMRDIHNYLEDTRAHVRP